MPRIYLVYERRNARIKSSSNTVIMNKLKEINKLKVFHLTIIVIGSIFVALSIFHTNLWFDECYSLSIAEHSFSEIWTIGATDVHPILYYFILHIVGLITNYNIIVFRIVSLIPIIILGILGYTHIKKDFGEKTGVIFSFLVFFLPVSAEYAGEIRMYSLGMLLGTLMAIYAYRIYKGQESIKNFLIFGTSSLFVSYTHYYGLMFAGIVNLLLFIFYLKNREEKSKGLKSFIITAIVQIICYLPWLLIFLNQVKGVSNGFWISLSFPKTLIELVSVQFSGSLGIYIGLIFALLLIGYVIYIYFYNKHRGTNIDKKPILISCGIYIGIILIAWLISITVQCILLYRYLLIITGLYIFILAFLMSKDENKYRLAIVCSIIVVISTLSNIGFIKENYDSNNYEHINYINQNIQKDDIILYSDAISGAVISTYFDDNKSYFYNKQNWPIEEEYKAFSNMNIIYDIKELINNYKGRVWILEGNTSELLNEVKQINKDCDVIYEKTYYTKYKDNIYTIELVELE